jgi:hypothetical protein
MTADTDVLALEVLYAFETGQSVTYDATLSSTGWTSTQQGGPTLFGTYSGQPLSVTYVGNTAAYPAGAITWTSTGTYGTDAWSGTGSATVTSLSSTTFTIQFVYSMTAGNNSLSLNYQVPGSLDQNGNVTFNGESGTGTGMYVINKGKPKELFKISFSFQNIRLYPPPPYYESDIVDTDTGNITVPYAAYNLWLFQLPRIFGPVYTVTITDSSEPTLPQWAAIIMGLALVTFSIFRMRRQYPDAI